MAVEVLGIIPARGGSKGIPNKNRALLAGKPLLAYTCEQALAARKLSRVILSTEDDRLIQCGQRCGVEAPFVRPCELAADQTPMIDVVTHALDTLRRQEGYAPDVVVLLQPTSPLRQGRQIDEAIGLAVSTGTDTVVSVVEVPHRFHPFSVMRLDDGVLREFWKAPLPMDRFHRQALPVLYARNGPAILVVRVSSLLARKDFYGGRVVPYLMQEGESVDIDTVEDLRMAEFLLAAQSLRTV